MDRAFEAARKIAPVAGKVCGAGGGGCFFVYLPGPAGPKHGERDDVAARIDAAFTTQGIRRSPSMQPRAGWRSRSTVRETRRYLGLELAGAKNQKTALAALEYYPKEKKIFLLDIYDRITGHRGRDEGPTHERSEGTSHHHESHPPGLLGLTTAADEALLELLTELSEDAEPKHHGILMGVNVPLQLPPAIACARKTCAKPTAGTLAAVKWMREAHRKAERQARTDANAPRVTEYTTYTQRPVELWVRYQVLSRLPEAYRFEIDETLGGNKAPLTARMQFIRRHLEPLPFAGIWEVWPKLTVSLLGLSLELPGR